MSETSTVTVNEQPVKVTVSGNTPTVTVTDEATQKVTVLQSQPVTVALAQNQPKVIVNTGVGTPVDVSTLLQMLDGKLDTIHLDPTLSSDLTRLQDLWARIGTDLLLTYPEGAAIQEAARSYTDNQITDTVADIDITTDGKISAAVSTVQQTALSIDQRIDLFEQDVNGIFTDHSSRILQTENAIISTVSRLDSVDGPGGDVEMLESSIDQTASGLTLEVSAREETDLAVMEVRSQISQLSDAISLSVENLQDIADRLSAAELSIDPDGIDLEVVTQNLSEISYALNTIQRIFTNRWGVTITEDINGIAYATGFQLLTHPVWLSNEDYVIDATVEFTDEIFKCIADHTSSSINSPGSVDAANYWELVPEETKSSFTVSAEEFSIWTPNGDIPLFVVNETSVEINPELKVIADIIQSSNFGSEGPDESSFSLDRQTGQAVFNNIVMSFGSGSSGYENLIDRPQSIQEISPEEYAQLEAGGSFLVYSWAGNEALNVYEDISGADEWVFDSEFSGGAIVLLEFDQETEGLLEVALNEEHLTLDQWDSGSVTEDTEAVVDLTQPGDSVNLGGLF